MLSRGDSRFADTFTVKNHSHVTGERLYESLPGNLPIRTQGGNAPLLRRGIFHGGARLPWRQLYTMYNAR